MLNVERGGKATAMVFSRTPLPAEERQVARSLLAALDPFREIRGDMPLQYVTTLLLVAAEEGLASREYAERAGVSASSMSRHMLDLSVSSRRVDGEGLDLLMSRPNPMELRKHEIFLTPRGRALVHRMLRAWQLGCEQGKV